MPSLVSTSPVVPSLSGARPASAGRAPEPAQGASFHAALDRSRAAGAALAESESQAEATPLRGAAGRRPAAGGDKKDDTPTDALNLAFFGAAMAAQIVATLAPAGGEGAAGQGGQREAPVDLRSAGLPAPTAADVPADALAAVLAEPASAASAISASAAAAAAATPAGPATPAIDALDAGPAAAAAANAAHEALRAAAAAAAAAPPAAAPEAAPLPAMPADGAANSALRAALQPLAAASANAAATRASRSSAAVGDAAPVAASGALEASLAPAESAELALAAGAVPSVADALAEPGSDGSDQGGGLLQATTAPGERMAVEAARMPKVSVAPLVGSAEWAPAIGQQMLRMSASGVQTAQLNLNPEGLGPLQITLTLGADAAQAQAMFVSAHEGVRKALEAALPQLRTTLAEQGISLGHTSVGGETRQPAGQGGAFADQGASRSPNRPDYAAATGDGAAAVATPMPSPARVLHSQGSGVDTFA